MPGSPSQGCCPGEDASSARNASLLQASLPSPSQEPLPALRSLLPGPHQGHPPNQKLGFGTNRPCSGTSHPTLGNVPACREREGKHASTAPMGFQGPVTLGPPSGHRDRCGQCLSPGATWERVFRGCPGNVSCRSLRTTETR